MEHLWLHVNTNGGDVGSDRVNVDTLWEDAHAEGGDRDGARRDREASKSKLDGRNCTQTTSVFSMGRHVLSELYNGDTHTGTQIVRTLQDNSTDVGGL